MYGRMVAGRPAQTFTFEGVESSLLDFTVRATSNESAPLVEVRDPEGQVLDVSGATVSQAGDATLKVRNLVLPKTGIYQVVARPAHPGREVFYSFEHQERYAPPPPQTVRLTASAPTPVYVSAPRGGLIAFTIRPARGSDLQPDVQAVRDPWGGPALDPAQVPHGANPPRVSHAADGAMILTFTVPRPGLYTILAAAKPGAPGVGTLNVDVRKPAHRARAVYHGGTVARGRAPAAAYGSPDGAAPAAASAQVQPPAPPVDPPVAQR